jgi:hypothetical protein
MNFMKILQTTAAMAIAVFAVLVTIAGASAIQFSYSSMSSTPFGFDGYGTVRITERGSGSYGASWSPETIAGGWSYGGNSGGFGYDRGEDSFRAIGINSGGVRGSWNRGFGGPNYGAVSIGANARNSYWAVNSFGNAWGSQAAYYSPYSGGWGSGYNGYANTWPSYY